MTAAVLDRACGVLLGTAAGDALGAGYEFGSPLPRSAVVEMRGGGAFRWEPGEWTDDTAMAIAIAQVAAQGADLRSSGAQDLVVRAWLDWAETASDVGAQTRTVLSAVRRRADDTDGLAQRATEAAREHHDRTGRSGGNGSLMRTAPVALAYLDDELGLIDAASRLSALTHYDPEAAEACVLWSLAIRHAVLTGEIDVRRGLPALAPDRAVVWARRFDDAEHCEPSHFEHNGWVVEALQGAWSAIRRTAVPVDAPHRGSFRVDHLRLSLEAAVRGGRDTDTVAAIAGGLLGAAYGASAVPAQWRRVLNGWPGLRARDLVEMAGRIVRRGAPDAFDFTYSGYRGIDALAPHPYDDGLLLGGIGALRTSQRNVDAVVSLCRVGDVDVPANAELVDVRLVDREGAEHNPNLGFVLHDTAALIESLRREGRTVLLHCVQAHSRTPAVAAMYGMRTKGVSADQALDAVEAVLPHARSIETFRAALRAAQPDRSFDSHPAAVDDESD